MLETSILTAVDITYHLTIAQAWAADVSAVLIQMLLDSAKNIVAVFLQFGVNIEDPFEVYFFTCPW